MSTSSSDREPPPQSTPQSTPGREDWGDLPQLKSLRRLVTILTATLTIGVLTIAAALVIRILSESAAPAVLAPMAVNAEALTLPAGETIIAAGAGPDAIAVATRAADGTETLRLFDPADGALIRALPLIRE